MPIVNPQQLNCVGFVMSIIALDELHILYQTEDFRKSSCAILDPPCSIKRGIVFIMKIVLLCCASDGDMEETASLETQEAAVRSSQYLQDYNSQMPQ